MVRIPRGEDVVGTERENKQVKGRSNKGRKCNLAQLQSKTN